MKAAIFECLLHSFTFLPQTIIWVLVAEIARRDGVSPLLAFVVGMAVPALTVSLGILLGGFLLFNSADYMMTAQLLAALAILILTVLFSANGGHSRRILIPDEQNVVIEFEDLDRMYTHAVNQRLSSFAALCHLSDREREVFCSS